MAITYTFEANKVLAAEVLNEYTNVFKKIYWTITFTDGINESKAAGETWLDCNNIENFIEATSVTDAMMETWVIEDLGTQWTNLINNHTSILQQQAAEHELSTYYVNDSFVEPTQESRDAALKNKLIELGVVFQ